MKRVRCKHTNNKELYQDSVLSIDMVLYCNGQIRKRAMSDCLLSIDMTLSVNFNNIILQAANAYIL